MALFTSTPKISRQEDKVALLNFEESDDENTSGYDSPVYLNNEQQVNTKVKTHWNTRHADLSDDSDFSSDESANDTFSDDGNSSDDLDDLEDVQSTEDSMKVTSMKSLIDNIRFILSMPDLCDVTFLVGPQRVPVHGLKSILGTRSRVLFNMFVKQSKEEMNSKKKTKKSKGNQTGSANRTLIIIDSYDVDVFRTFVTFVHCGSAILDASTVVGLLCCATEFDIPDLKEACYEFVGQCMSTAITTVVMKETFRYGDHNVAVKLRQTVKDQQQQLQKKLQLKCEQRLSPVGKETEVL